MILLVCAEEKVSVEAVKMIAAQSSAGHQARSHGGMEEKRGTRRRTLWRLGAERGLRQGSVEDIQ